MRTINRAIGMLKSSDLRCDESWMLLAHTCTLVVYDVFMNGFIATDMLALNLVTVGVNPELLNGIARRAVKARPQSYLVS